MDGTKRYAAEVVGSGIDDIASNNPKLAPNGTIGDGRIGSKGRTSTDPSWLPY